MRRRSGRSVICATPVQADGTLGGQANWVTISAENADASRPRFSSDGSTIYYEIRTAGVLSLVKQRLDATTKRALEGPVQLASVEFAGTGQNLVAVTRDRVFFNTNEVRSNIWMTPFE